ncbi:MAG: hypothetical protein MUP58_02430 [Candidatus Nanohaloarchaeota archaeon QJJ-9]|nr:hypothetical protein [Candidatus Nanohaloarchaeota archaeon QJJ-9]
MKKALLITSLTLALVVLSTGGYAATTDPQCSENEGNPECSEATDDWICGEGKWACDNGEKKDPGNYSASECKEINVKDEYCYSSYNNKHICYSDGEKWNNRKPEGCTCNHGYECISSVCDSGVCISYTAPEVTVETVETINFQISQITSYTLDIKNKLPTEDNLTLTFKGSARDLVEIKVTESDKVDCNSSTNQCNITVPGKSSANVLVNIRAVSYGSGGLTSEVFSEKTELKDTETIDITVEPTVRGDESAPGITLPYFIGIISLAGVAVYFQRRSL